jgi:cAMP phosphodiesterase
MKIELLPSTVGETAARQFCIGAIVNGTIAVDAGTLGLLWPLERQCRVRTIFLSHSHLDHIATLPLFLVNVYNETLDCPTVYASEATLQSLQQDVFNNRLWPDFVKLSKEETPFLELQTLVSEDTVDLPGLTVTPIALDHIIPTLGFILQDEASAVAFVSDTNSTDRVWEVLAKTERLRAVFLEASFPNSERWLAEKSGHLCSEMFASELTKLDDSVRVIACHLKPSHFDTIASELSALDRPNLEIGVPGREYNFS